MTTPRHLRPLHNVVDLIDPALGRSDDFLRKYGIGNRSFQSGWRLVAVGEAALAVDAHGGAHCPGDPIKCHIGEERVTIHRMPAFNISLNPIVQKGNEACRIYSFAAGQPYKCSALFLKHGSG